MFVLIVVEAFPPFHVTAPKVNTPVCVTSGKLPVDIVCSFTQNINELRFTRRFPIGFPSQIEFTMFLYDMATEVITALNGCYRAVTVTTTGITFGNGNMIYDGKTYRDWPNRCVPLKIYGVK